MFIERTQKKETLASRILGRSFDYGQANQIGQTFDRRFNRENTERVISNAQNSVGQSKVQLSYPNGMSPDGYSSMSATLGVSVASQDPKRVFEQTAETQLQLFWRQNRERLLKYYRVAGRAEVSEALEEICNEAIYPNDGDEICSLAVDRDSDIGETVKIKLHKIFRQDVLKRITGFADNGWEWMKTLLVEGRLFFEVSFDPTKNEITAVNLLPSQNMIIVVQDCIVVGYRQMLEGQFATADMSKPYIDFSVNQILYCDLGMYGPGGINDPRSPLEYAIKPFNQLNSIEDSIIMYRIQWGSEKMVFYIDTGMMPKPKAEKHMKDQMKLLSRRVDYNTGTGEITNYGRVIGLGEHFFMSTSSQTQGSKIERLPSGENISNIDDLKYFKRNLVNAMKVPPGRITALAGDGENYSNGKVGEVTQAEVSFARMVYRYQRPVAKMLRRLFVMVLNTKNMLSDDIKSEDNFDVKFNKMNSFQQYIDAEILNTNLGTFKSMMEFVWSEENPAGILSPDFALRRGLKMSDADLSFNTESLLRYKKMVKDNGDTATPDGGDSGDGDGGGLF
jgi:hypothetical protein